MKNRLPVLLISLLILGCCLPAANADHQVVERVTVTVAPENTPRNTGTITTWIADEHMVRIDELNNVTTIVRLDTQPEQMIIILHERKEVLEIDLPLEMPEHLVPAFAELKMQWDINRRSDEQTIGRWECKLFEINGNGPIKVELDIWATIDTTIDTRRYHAMLGESFRATPIFYDMADKIFSISPFFAIKTRIMVEQLGQRSITETLVESITETATPQSALEIPEDYTRRNLDFSSYLSLIRTTKPATDF